MAEQPPPLWLTADELADLTGLTQPAAQRRWLAGHGIRDVYERADGSLRVPRYHFEAPRDRQRPAARRDDEPDYRAVRSLR